MVSGGECGGFWVPDLNYLCVAGAEPPVGLRIYLRGWFRPVAVGGMVVVQGTRDGVAAWGFDSNGGGLGDAAIGPSLSPPLTSRCSSYTS